MIELLGTTQFLKDPKLRLEGVSVAGVALGGPAQDVLAKVAVQQARAQIVHSSSWTAQDGAEYFDESGARIPFQEGVGSALSYGGTLNSEGSLGFHIADGRVIGVAVYGHHLQCFGYIKDHDHLLREFGEPDRSVTVEAYGDLMGYEHFYTAAEKVVHWDSGRNRVSLILLGKVAHVTT